MATTYPYQDASLSVDERIKDLLGRMTLEEKAAQLGGVWCNKLYPNGKFSRAKAKELLSNGIGQLTRPVGEKDMKPRRAAEIIKEVQEYIAKHTRLRIPAMVHEECLTGFMARKMTSFPQSIGLAGTFQPEIVQDMTTVVRGHLRALGAVQGLSPVLDVIRDPRWGRTEETYGEDQVLVAAMATAFVKGLQGDDRKTGVDATLKHFAAHGAPEGGRNIASVHCGPREYREVFLFPFEAAVKRGKARSVMNAYHELDGVPAAADRSLLTGILREEWGFDGYVVSDYWSIDRLQTIHRTAADKKEAAVQALEAGIDMEIPDLNYYGAPLIQAVREGLISQSTIDTAVSRILRAKFELGVFEKPYVSLSSVPAIFDTPEMREKTRYAAQQSMALLKNNGVLPLKKSIKSLAVIGPNANSKRNIFGDYAYTAHLSEESDIKTPTILDGIKAAVSKRTAVAYAMGCKLMGDDVSGFKAAVKKAQEAEIAVVVIGERAGLRENDLSGENRDRATLALPGKQEELLEAIIETGTPVVVVLINGRPLAFPNLIDKCAAIVEAWYPGEEGGNAVADVLFGAVNPGGKLPISFPRDVGHIPVHYNRKPASTGPYFTGDTDPTSRVPSAPLFPFGHGLSYTTFNYSGLSISPRKSNASGVINIQCKVTNAGKVKGDEVVQLYIHDEVASCSRPVKELKAFQRVTLSPGKSKTITFKLSLDQLAFYDPQMRFVVEPGSFEAQIGSSSEDIRLRGRFVVTGQPKIVMSQRKFFTEIEVK